ncbi:MAG: tetratricopeptide repeat protein [Myxococcota bacterium]
MMMFSLSTRIAALLSLITAVGCVSSPVEAPSEVTTLKPSSPEPESSLPTDTQAAPEPSAPVKLPQAVVWSEALIPPTPEAVIKTVEAMIEARDAWSEGSDVGPFQEALAQHANGPHGVFEGEDTTSLVDDSATTFSRWTPTRVFARRNGHPHGWLALNPGDCSGWSCYNSEIHYPLELVFRLRGDGSAFLAGTMEVDGPTTYRNPLLDVWMTTIVNRHRAVANARNLKGLKLHKKGDLDAAIKAYRQALTQDPTHVWARFNLACALAVQGDTDGAFNALAWLRRDPSPEALMPLSRVEIDPELASLKGDPRLEPLLEEIRAVPPSEAEVFWLFAWRFRNMPAKVVDPEHGVLSHTCNPRAQALHCKPTPTLKGKPLVQGLAKLHTLFGAKPIEGVAGVWTFKDYRGPSPNNVIVVLRELPGGGLQWAGVIQGVPDEVDEAEFEAELLPVIERMRQPPTATVTPEAN